MKEMDAGEFYASYKAKSVDGTVQALIRIARILAAAHYRGAIRLHPPMEIATRSTRGFGTHTFFTLRNRPDKNHLLAIESAIKAVFPKLRKKPMIAFPKVHNGEQFIVLAPKKARLRSYSRKPCPRTRGYLRSTWFLPIGGGMPQDPRPLTIPITKISRGLQALINRCDEF